MAVVGRRRRRVQRLVQLPLATIPIDREQMGARAAGMPMRMGDEPDTSPGRESVEVTLVRRASA